MVRLGEDNLRMINELEFGEEKDKYYKASGPMLKAKELITRINK
jgi:hypothetical protein